MSKLKPTAIEPFNRSRKKVPELSLDVPSASKPDADQSIPTVTHKVPEGKPKLVLTIGSGHSGKSTLLRWVTERAVERGSGLVMATLAPNRTLRHYFPTTMFPEANSTSAGAEFLEMFFDGVAENKLNAVLDFPGDDTALPHLLDQGLDLPGMMEKAGVELVALFTLTPRVEGLTALNVLASKGFSPAATALVRNQGLTPDPTLPPEPAFEVLMEHSAYRAAVARGAAEIWMPRLYAAKVIEDYRLPYASARDSAEIGPANQSRTAHWLNAMELAFAPIASWLP